MTQANAKDVGFDPERLARVERLIDADIDANRYDGAAIRVTRGDHVALSATRGFAERASGRRLESDAVFATMSVGKQFTNTIVLNRIERGDLRLMMPVSELIPEFGKRGKERMTLFHLLTHTSGITSRVPALPPEDLVSIERLVAWACTTTPESLAGERVNYSIAVAHAVMAEMVRRGGRHALLRADPRGGPLPAARDERDEPGTSSRPRPAPLSRGRALHRAGTLCPLRDRRHRGAPLDSWRRDSGRWLSHHPQRPCQVRRDARAWSGARRRPHPVARDARVRHPELDRRQAERAPRLRRADARLGAVPSLDRSRLLRPRRGHHPRALRQPLEPQDVRRDRRGIDRLLDRPGSRPRVLFPLDRHHGGQLPPRARVAALGRRDRCTRPLREAPPVGTR